jgi:hypothetical protein
MTAVRLAAISGTARASLRRMRYAATLLLALAALAPAAAGASPAKSAAAPAAGSAPRAVLPFVVDDYDKALHEARARGIPIFIEAWAPW